LGEDVEATAEDVVAEEDVVEIGEVERRTRREDGSLPPSSVALLRMAR
jgi:hypothetical protein